MKENNIVWEEGKQQLADVLYWRKSLNLDFVSKFTKPAKCIYCKYCFASRGQMMNMQQQHLHKSSNLAIVYIVKRIGHLSGILSYQSISMASPKHLNFVTLLKRQAQLLRAKESQPLNFQKEATNVNINAVHCLSSNQHMELIPCKSLRIIEKEYQK